MAADDEVQVWVNNPAHETLAILTPQGQSGSVAKVVDVLHGVGTAEITVSPTHPVLAECATGATYIDVLVGGREFFTGPVTEVVWADGSRGDAQIRAESWWSGPASCFVYPDPAVAFDGAQPARYDLTGNAEDVASVLMFWQWTNLRGWPIGVLPSQARGPTVSVSLRLTPLLEGLVPVLEASGLTWSTRHWGAGLIGDGLVVGGVQPRVLSLPVPEVMVTSAKITASAATVTHAATGGQGEAELRDLTGPVTRPAGAVWFRRDAFVDARDTDEAAVQGTRADEALDEGAAAVEFDIELGEGPGFRWGTDYSLGDIVTVDMLGMGLTDRVRSIELDLSSADGVRITPKVGTQRAATDLLTAAVARLASRQRTTGSV